MASTKISFFKLVLVVAAFGVAIAGDPDILSDFIVPLNTAVVDGNLFTFTGMRSLVNSTTPPKFKVFKATMAEFPVLEGQSVSYAILIFPAGTVNPPHTHPRASELLFLIQGVLEVGLVDTTNKLYAQTLLAGDMFVFPKGLAHYQFYNSNDTAPAVAISAFGSANAGTVSVPNTVFNTSIPDDILAKSFKTNKATIDLVKQGLAH